MPNHSVCGLVALATSLAAGTSNATEGRMKPPLHGPPLVDVQSPRIRGAVEKCSELATSRRVFGDVTVTIADLSNPRVSGSPMLGPHRDVIVRCVREALGSLLRRLEREGDPGGKAADRWPQPFTWTIGQALPLLPPLETLLPRWEAAITAPRRDGGAPATTLAAVLPAGVSLRNDGCLGISLQGPAIVAGLDLWARRSGRALHEMWFSLPFFDRLAPHRPSGVLVLSDSHLLVSSAGQAGDSLCFRRLEAQEVQTIRAQMERVGTCWQGGFEQMLRAPRVEFPADRVFESVSTNGLATCALDREGAMTCCGATLGLGESADVRWRSISLRQVGFCGVSKRGDLSCVAHYAPRLKQQKAVSQGIGPVCSIDERARPTCYRRSTRLENASPSRLDRGVHLGCRTRDDGGRECDTLSEILPAGGSWPAVDKISASEHGICAVSKDHHVVCSSAGQPVDRDVDFRDVATSPLSDAACALKSDGSLVCWSLRDGARLTFSPAGPFAALSPVLDTDVVCGIGIDHKILSARRTPASGAAVGLPVPPPDDFKAVTAAGRQYCGVTTAGKVLCWGTTWPGPNRWSEERRVAN